MAHDRRPLQNVQSTQTTMKKGQTNKKEVERWCTSDSECWDQVNKNKNKNKWGNHPHLANAGNRKHSNWKLPAVFVHFFYQ